MEKLIVDATDNDTFAMTGWRSIGHANNFGAKMTVAPSNNCALMFVWSQAISRNSILDAAMATKIYNQNKKKHWKWTVIRRSLGLALGQFEW